MVATETELEMVQRHIRQGERHVSRQHEIIAELTLRNQPTWLAESLLLDFQDVLRAHQDHLGRIISNRPTTRNLTKRRVIERDRRCK